MSDLATFAEHARAMSTAEHKPECLNPPEIPEGIVLARDGDDRPIGYSWQSRIPAGIPRACPGCVTDSDRALWGRLADEVDAYLTVDHEEGLFG